MKMEQIIGSSVPEPLPAKAAPLPDNLSPQCIGREFVRCYYTLMHDNPNKLHRFYLDQSTFVHGNQTDETAGCVSGQRAIHEKIISLNFVDCRTKIKHVDSQPTIDNGVVVQVSGELSNAGKVPRRFMQTFVLGSQTPRKYYVHNDIFRYQDEVFGYEQDEAPEDEEASLDSTDELPEHHEEEEVEVEEEEEEEVVPEQPFYEEATNGVAEEVQNNNHEDHEEEVEAVEEPVEECEPEEAVTEQPEPAVEEEPVEQEEPTPEEEPVEEVVEEPVHVAPEVAPEPVPEVPKGPKSWAMIAGAGSAPATVVRVPPAQTTPPKQPKPAPEPKEAPKIKETPFQPFPKDPEVREVRESRGGRRGRSDSRGDRGERSERRFEGAGAFKERERYQEREAPNSYQIFVGNLPSGTGYADLEERFRTYGNVVHVRVTPNNFGFVVFENEAPVQEILGEVRSGEKFFLNDQRLNIEEKKTAINPSRGPRKPFSDQRGNSRGGRGRRGGGRPPFIDTNSDSK